MGQKARTATVTESNGNFFVHVTFVPKNNTYLVGLHGQETMASKSATQIFIRRGKKFIKTGTLDGRPVMTLWNPEETTIEDETLPCPSPSEIRTSRSLRKPINRDGARLHRLSQSGQLNYHDPEEDSPEVTYRAETPRRQSPRRTLDVPKPKEQGPVTDPGVHNDQNDDEGLSDMDNGNGPIPSQKGRAKKVPSSKKHARSKKRAKKVSTQKKNMNDEYNGSDTDSSHDEETSGEVVEPIRAKKKTGDEILKMVQDLKKTYRWKLGGIGNPRRLIASYGLRLWANLRQELNERDRDFVTALVSTADNKEIEERFLKSEMLQEVGQRAQFWMLCGFEEAIANECCRITSNISEDELGQGLHQGSNEAQVKKVYDRMNEVERLYVSRFPPTGKLIDAIASVWASVAFSKDPKKSGKLKGVNDFLYEAYTLERTKDITQTLTVEQRRRLTAFKLVPLPFFQVIDYVQKVNSNYSITLIIPK
jgi:hypothetical protein